MKFEDSIFVAAPPQAVWACLADNKLLARCIPGCTEIRKKPERGFIAQIELSLAFVSRTLEVHMLRRNIQPQAAVTFVATVFPKHRATAGLTLTPEGSGTRIAYAVDLALDGMMSKGLGGMVVTTTARKLTADFCERLGKVAQAQQTGTKQE